MSADTWPADGNPTNLRHCTIDDCPGAHYARGLCVRHYRQLRRHGTPTPPRPPRRRLPASFKVRTG